MQPLPKETLRKAQLLQLNMLKKLDEICRANDIQYFLSDGTLLGAIRHNGFIPWDDDLDVGMTRENYTQFCKIANNCLPDNIFLQTNKTDSDYPLPFAKLRLKGTKWIERFAENCNYEKGIYIDIFPFDKVDDLSIIRKIKFVILNALTCALERHHDYQFSCNNKIKDIVVTILSNCSDNVLNRIYDFLLFKVYKKKKAYVLFSRYYFLSFFKLILDKDIYTDLIIHKFEDGEFYIPRQYDLVLTQIFGDYMQMPPVEKRTNHGIIECDFGVY